MGLWFWLYVVYKFIGATCPFTSKLGALLSMVAMIASYVFIVLVFFMGAHWWYGLLLLAVTFVVPLLVPKVNPYEFPNSARVVSGLLSHLSPILVVLMYLSFFGAI